MKTQQQKNEQEQINYCRTFLSQVKSLNMGISTSTEAREAEVQIKAGLKY
jgi:hypothetical protein